MTSWPMTTGSSANGQPPAGSSANGQPPGARPPEPRGRQGGRPSVITPELLAAATAMRDRRELTMAQIARTLKIGRSTLYKHLDLSQETSGEDELAA
jgi:hypothetical protein